MKYEQPMSFHFSIFIFCLKAICVLPNNIVHQKFYLFLWFWLIFLVTSSSLLILYRLALYLLPAFRAYVTNTVWTGEKLKYIF